MSNLNKGSCQVDLSVGYMKPEEATISLEGSFKVDQPLGESLSSSIGESMGENGEWIKNKVVMQLSVDENSGNRALEELREFLRLQIVNHKKSLFQLLKVDNIKVALTSPKQITLVAEFVDDIHLIIADVRRLFFNPIAIDTHSTTQNSEASTLPNSSLYFSLFLKGKDNLFDSNNSSNSFLFLAVLLSLQIHSDSPAFWPRFFDVLGVYDMNFLKMIFYKMKQFKLNLNFDSFEKIPNKNEFLSWLFSLQNARYSPEEISLLKAITKEVIPKVRILSIFRDSGVILDLTADVVGIFESIQKYNQGAL